MHRSLIAGHEECQGALSKALLSSVGLSAAQATQQVAKNGKKAANSRLVFAIAHEMGHVFGRLHHDRGDPAAVDADKNDPKLYTGSQTCLMRYPTDLEETLQILGIWSPGTGALVHTPWEWPTVSAADVNAAPAKLSTTDYKLCEDGSDDHYQKPSCCVVRKR